MIFISKGCLQKDAQCMASMKWKWKQKQKTEMKVKNERDISEHKSCKQSVKKNSGEFYYTHTKL